LAGTTAFVASSAASASVTVASVWVDASFLHDEIARPRPAAIIKLNKVDLLFNVFFMIVILRFDLLKK
jgi:hypothetical protein